MYTFKRTIVIALPKEPELIKPHLLRTPFEISKKMTS
jgi:hypothetical protein